MELLAELNWIDLVIIALLAGAVFIGFTQGLIRYVLNAVAVIVAFVLAGQLKGPLVDLLGFWTAFTPDMRELLVFLVLFFGLVIGGWFVIRTFYRRTRLPIVRQVDEIGGAAFGVVFAALVITFHLVVLDTFFRGNPDAAAVASAGGLRGWYDLMNSSLIVEFFRQTIIPTAGFLARPFLPSEVAAYLLP